MKQSVLKTTRSVFNRKIGEYQEVAFELLVNHEALVDLLAKAAAHNKSGRANLGKGAITLKEINREIRRAS